MVSCSSSSQWIHSLALKKEWNADQKNALLLQHEKEICAPWNNLSIINYIILAYYMILALYILSLNLYKNLVHISNKRNLICLLSLNFNWVSLMSNSPCLIMNGICRFNHIRIYIATFLIIKDAILLEINNNVETHLKRTQYKGSFF